MRALLFAGLVTIAAAAALAACSGGGDGDAEQAPALIAPTASVPAGPPSATIAPAAALTLIVVSDGATDELLLEWTGGPARRSYPELVREATQDGWDYEEFLVQLLEAEVLARRDGAVARLLRQARFPDLKTLDATKWQYRRATWNQKKSVPNPWGDWMDIPGSTASTRSYLLTGLSSATGHRFEVRAVVGTTAGEASNLALGLTHAPGAYPQMSPEDVVEGDGVTEWRVHMLGFVITIPDGVRMEAGWGGTPADGQSSVDVWVVDPYLAGILFSRDGHVLNRHIPVPEGSDSAATDMRAAEALLDKIISSLRRLD